MGSCSCYPFNAGLHKLCRWILVKPIRQNNVLLIQGIRPITLITEMKSIGKLFCKQNWYDESGYYYLQSRYYDPEVGRFINVDALVATGQGLLGNNMFAYCNNCPVNCFDLSGHSILGAIIKGGASWLIGNLI